MNLRFSWKQVILLGACLISHFFLSKSIHAYSEMGPGELSRLVEIHLPKTPPDDPASLDEFENFISISPDMPDVTITIPGFKFFKCGKCHKANDLAEKSGKRLGKVVSNLKMQSPWVKDVPLKRYIIQSYSNALLQKGQFAHATFDAIRISPATILIDVNAYGLATHLHELLHLTQPFLGHANELEAYALNTRSDPRFLLFNSRYFQNVVQAFVLPDFPNILETFFSRDIKKELKLPAETQWFLLPANEETLERVAKAVKFIQPITEEAFQINRADPFRVAYWSDRTGIPSLALDLAAIKTLRSYEHKVSEKLLNQAFKLFRKQFGKTDNTALGYIIDRKNEVLMTLRYLHGMNNPAQGLSLYFQFLKKRFIASDEKLNLQPDDAKDYANYIKRKVNEIIKLANHPGMSKEEREAGLRFAENIKKKISVPDVTESVK